MPKTAKKAAKKKAPIKKAASKTRQTGESNTRYDKLVQAKKPGKRKSAAGNTYYERRANRSDAGKLLGVPESRIYKVRDVLERNVIEAIAKLDRLKKAKAPKMEIERAKKTVQISKAVLKEQNKLIAQALR